MRSRYRVLEPHAPHFITSTVVAWLPVFTTKARCDILVDSLKYCREHKQLRVYAWVILDNHFHAVVSAPDLARVMADLKRHTAQRIVEQLERENCEWLLHQLGFFRAKHKEDSRHQIWQEGFHPQAITDDKTLGQKIDYIHDNPVVRGLVAGREHWRYSSAHQWLTAAEPCFRCDEFDVA